jgi:phosphoribosyl 1,2-cyclic phosphodiesterase
MWLRVWGARGSIPTPISTDDLRDRLSQALERSRGVDVGDPVALQRFIERLPPQIGRVVSGNTSCYEVRAGEQTLILDMGSGLRLLGRELITRPEDLHIFISHTHYDHIEGFPFFAPAFHKGFRLHFYSPYPDLEQRLREMMRPPFFPVDLDYPQAPRFFYTLDPAQTHLVAGVKVRLLELNHPGQAFAYRMEQGGKTLVYASDGEYPNMNPEATQTYEDFFREADALIFDAMYTYQDAVNTKAEWGHSTANVGAELAWRAEAKRLILHHHDPISTDSELWSKVEDADQHLRYRALKAGLENQTIEVILAYEGLSLEL